MSRALVTGGSRGIGAAIAKALARAGHTVIINFRSQREHAEKVAADIETAGGKAVLAQFDVRDREATHASLTRSKSPDFFTGRSEGQKV